MVVPRECGPELIGFLLVIADPAARHPCSMPDADLLDSSSVMNLQLTQLQQTPVSASKVLLGGLNDGYGL
jgi:hypothetical protein